MISEKQQNWKNFMMNEWLNNRIEKKRKRKFKDDKDMLFSMTNTNKHTSSSSSWWLFVEIISRIIEKKQNEKNLLLLESKNIMLLTVFVCQLPERSWKDPIHGWWNYGEFIERERMWKNFMKKKMK